jgi:hypothetical protein
MQKAQVGQDSQRNGPVVSIDQKIGRIDIIDGRSAGRIERMLPKTVETTVCKTKPN